MLEYRAGDLVLAWGNKPIRREIVPDRDHAMGRKNQMRRFVLIVAALLASLTMTVSASARLGVAPMAAPDGGVIEVKRGRGRGHGHKHRGRGHHYGWYRGRGHHKWRHHRSW
jgi:hypothetical protein